MNEKKTVLVVEDDTDSRELLTEFLCSEGYLVNSAADGEEVLKFLAEHSAPKVILLDLTLPKMTGDELMTALNARRDRPQMKIIIVSGWDNLAARAKTLGADNCISKPIDLQQLNELVARVSSTF